MSLLSLQRFHEVPHAECVQYGRTNTYMYIYIYILKGVRCYLIIYFRLVMQLYAVDDVLNHSP